MDFTEDMEAMDVTEDMEAMDVTEVMGVMDVTEAMEVTEGMEIQYMESVKTFHVNSAVLADIDIIARRMINPNVANDSTIVWIYAMRFPHTLGIDYSATPNNQHSFSVAKRILWHSGSTFCYAKRIIRHNQKIKISTWFKIYKIHILYIPLVRMSNKIQVNQYNPSYPIQPQTDPRSCGINEIYRTIHPDQPWERTAVGPSSIKHLYTGIPNYYPIRRINRPVDTLYGTDYSLYHKTGVGRGKRIGYQYKIYPLTDRNVREQRVYADYILPYMDFKAWTRHPIVRDSTPNSPLQFYPYAYH